MLSSPSNIFELGGTLMKKVIELALILTVTACVALAGNVTAPEIDASAGAAAITLLAGGLLVLRSRRRS